MQRYQIILVLRAAIRNFHLGPCKIEKSKISKLCHNKGLPKPFTKKYKFQFISINILPLVLNCEDRNINIIAM